MTIRFTLTTLLLVVFTLPTMAFQDSQEDLLAKLTGKKAVKAGQTLKTRYTQEERKISADYLSEQLNHICDEVSIDAYSDTGNNVIGIIRATTETNEWMLFGAHFDSVRDSPGANDNASGTALVYEVAKSIAALSERKYNVYIVFFDEEERGLIGSRNLAKKLKNQGVKLITAHTVDQMGWDDDGDRGIELEMPTRDLAAFYRKVARDNGFKFPIHMTNVTSTDHQAFRELGFDAIGLTEEYKNRDTTPHYHKPSDTFETVELGYLSTITEYMKKVFEALLTQ